MISLKVQRAICFSLLKRLPVNLQIDERAERGNVRHNIISGTIKEDPTSNPLKSLYLEDAKNNRTLTERRENELRHRLRSYQVYNIAGPSASFFFI